MSKAHFESVSLDNFDMVKAAPAAFTGNTNSTRGDADNTPTTNLFAVTGEVLVGVFGVCTTNLAQDAGTATIKVGVTGNVAGLIASVNVEDIDANDIWLDSTPSVGLDVTDALSFYIVVNGLDIIETVATKDVDSGQIYYLCLWRPISPDGSVKKGTLAST